MARLETLYDIEADIRGPPPEVRLGLRQKNAIPVVEALKPWLEESLSKVPKVSKVSKGGKLGEAIRDAFDHWDGLRRYLDDGRIGIDSDTVEHAIRGLALTRKNALFAGHDQGGQNWAMIASLLETCKLNGVEPLARTTDVPTKLVDRRSASRIDELMPWACVQKTREHTTWGGWPAYEPAWPASRREGRANPSVAFADRASRPRTATPDAIIWLT